MTPSLDNRVELCLGSQRTLINEGDIRLFVLHDCMGETTYPCSSANGASNQLVLGFTSLATGFGPPGDVVIQLGDDQLSRIVSNGGVLWSTGSRDYDEHGELAGLIRPAIRLYEDALQLSASSPWWGTDSSGLYSAIYSISLVSGPDAGSLEAGYHDFQNNNAKARQWFIDETTDHQSETFYLGEESGQTFFAYENLYFYEFTRMGTYEVSYGVSAPHDGATHSATETYTFHVGPIAELEVVSAEQTPEGLEIAAVNNGPDRSPGARAVLTTGQSCDFGGVFQHRDYLRSAEQSATRACVILNAQLDDEQLAGTKPIGYIENHVDYTVCIDSTGRDVLPKPAGESACQAEGGSWHVGNVYDYDDSNNEIFLSQDPLPALALQGARSRTVTHLIISWTRLEELFGSPVSHYHVERLDGAEWERLGSVPQPEDPQEEPEYVDTDQDRGSSPRYRVRAVNEEGEAGPWAEAGGVSQPGVVLALDPATIKEPDADAPDAVSTATVTATLTGAVSSQDVTVVVSAAPASGINPAEPNDFTLSENRTLTIPAGRRESTGVVTITAEEDADGDNEQVTITAVAAHAAGSISPLTLTIQDDDAPGLTLLPASGITVVEGGDNATYTVKLDAQPSSAVVVDITSDNPDVTAQSSTLTFQPETWNNPLTVTVSAGHDDDAAHDEFTLTHSINRSRSAPEYHSAAPATVTGTVMDIDMAGTMVSETRLTVAEGGAGGSYTVKLDTEPAGSVVITASSDNPDVRVGPASFTLHRNNWDQGYTVRVNADHDQDGAPDMATITHAIDAGRTTAGEYHGVPVDSVSVTVTDDDAPGVWVSPETLRIDEGRSGSYNVRLNTQPAGNVTITVSSDNGDVTVEPASLNFTASDWSRAQRVTVNAGRDDDSADDRATLSHGMSGADSDYQGLSGATVSVTVTDADRPGVTVGPLSPSPLYESGRLVEVTEGEGDDRVSNGRERIDVNHPDFPDEQHPSFYTVGLDTQPSGDVVIKLQSSNNKVTVWPKTLTFTSRDFGAKTVRLTAADDEDRNDETATITHTVDDDASADEYDGVRIDSVAVTVADNDDHGVTLLADYRDNDVRVEVIQPLVLREGETGQYSVVLDSQPDGHVWIEIKPSNPDKVSVSPSGLLFSGIQLHNGRIHPDWDEPQTVTVTALDDGDGADETVTLTHRIGDANATPGTWDLPIGARVGTVTVTVSDDDGIAQSRTASGGQSANAGYAWAGGDLGWGISVPVSFTYDWGVAESLTLRDLWRRPRRSGRRAGRWSPTPADG